jgi:hypothetical protein
MQDMYEKGHQRLATVDARSTSGVSDGLARETSPSATVGVARTDTSDGRDTVVIVDAMATAGRDWCSMAIPLSCQVVHCLPQPNGAGS